jgi:hypothetical protein
MSEMVMVTDKKRQCRCQEVCFRKLSRVSREILEKIGLNVMRALIAATWKDA